MNREIKFNYIYQHEETGYILLKFLTLQEIQNFPSSYFRINGYFIVAMRQYTGLKDKNGQEIYEGDIVTLNVLSEYERGKGNYYISKMFTVTYANQEFLPYRLDESIVIGNIYENPELLGE